MRASERHPRTLSARRLARVSCIALLGALSVASASSSRPAAAAPLRVLVPPFAGDAGVRDTATSEMVAAFSALPGLVVVGPAAIAAQLEQVQPPPSAGWVQRDAEVRRVLSAVSAQLALYGRVARDGGRRVLVLMLRGESGRVVAASRVERPAEGLGATASRMASRLRDLAFASLGVAAAPSPLPAPLPDAPVIVDVPSKEEEETPVEDAAGPSALPKPAAPRASPIASPSPAPVRGPSPGAFAGPRFELSVLPQYVSFQEGALNGSGFLLHGRLRVIPSVGGRTWARGLGFEAGVATALWTEGDTRFFEAVPTLFYEWRSGQGTSFEIRTGLAHRRASTAGGMSGETMSSSAWFLGGLAQWVGRRFLLRAIVALHPWATEHSFGFGLEGWAAVRVGPVAIGLVSRGEVYAGRRGQLYSAGLGVTLGF